MIELNDENFETEVSGKLSVIDFWAEWCGPCKTIAPIFEQFAHFAAESAENVLVAKVDIDNCPGIGTKYQIRNIPTILFLQDGAIIDKHVGVCTLAVLQDKLSKILAQ